MADTQSRKVAIVDDDAAVLDSFRFMLELAGFEVATYPSALAYLSHANDNPRCLILDHHMPVMTGLELTARLRAGGSMVPVLLITSAPTEDIFRRATALGVERVLGKPPTEEELVDFVDVFG